MFGVRVGLLRTELVLWLGFRSRVRVWVMIRISGSVRV